MYAVFIEFIEFTYLFFFFFDVEVVVVVVDCSNPNIWTIDDRWENKQADAINTQITGAKKA